MRVKKPKKPFMSGYKTYDTSNGFGTREEWTDAFFVRLGFDAAVAALGPDDPFVILGFAPWEVAKATWMDVQMAYRRLAIVNHPDKGGDIEIMKRINAAYEVLEHRFAKDRHK